MSSDPSSEFIHAKAIKQATKSDVQRHILEASKVLETLGESEKQQKKRRNVNLGDLEKLENTFEKLMNEENEAFQQKVYNQLQVRRVLVFKFSACTFYLQNIAFLFQNVLKFSLV